MTVTAESPRTVRWNVLWNVHGHGRKVQKASDFRPFPVCFWADALVVHFLPAVRLCQKCLLHFCISADCRAVLPRTFFWIFHGLSYGTSCGMSTDCPTDTPQDSQQTHSSMVTGQKMNCAFPSMKSRRPILSSFVITPKMPSGSFVTP